MPFQKGKSGNPNGRPTADRLVAGKSNNQIGKDELNKILRKLKPLSNEALAKLGVMLRDDTTSETAKLKVIVYILDRYKDLIQELYIESDEDDQERDLEPAEVKPLFSLVVPKDTE